MKTDVRKLPAFDILTIDDETEERTVYCSVDALDGLQVIEEWLLVDWSLTGSGANGRFGA